MAEFQKRVVLGSDGTPRILKTDSDGNLFIANIHGVYKYATWTDDTSGTTQTIWDPASGKQVHLKGLWISVDKACVIEIYDNASGTTIGILTLSGRTGTALPIGADITLTADNVLGAKLTSDAGVTTAYVTAFGHEH